MAGIVDSMMREGLNFVTGVADQAAPGGAIEGARRADLLDAVRDERRSFAARCYEIVNTTVQSVTSHPIVQPNRSLAGDHTLTCTTCEQPPGMNNCCGQVAMGTALSAHGMQVDMSEIARTNPAGIFTSPGTLTRFLDQRCGAIQHNNGSIDDLRQALDRGNPVVALVNAHGTPHWITITGYRTGEQGAVTHLQIRDRYFNSGGEGMMPVSEFQEAWRAPAAGSSCNLGPLNAQMFTGYRNLWIETGTRGNRFDRPFQTAADDLFTDAINNLVRGWSGADYRAFRSGLIEGGFSLVSTPLALMGRSSTALGDWILGAPDRVRQSYSTPSGSSDPIDRILLQPAATILGHGCRAFGEASTNVGNHVARIGSFLGLSN